MRTYGLAHLALTRYPHDAASLDTTLPHFRTSANAVYPFLQGRQLCFLRLAPEEEKPLTHVQAEIDFIEYLRRHGYPAMKPLPNHAGETAWLLASPWGRWCVSAFEGVKGRPVEEASPTPELLHAMGVTLAQLHALGAEYHPCLLPTHADVLDEVRQTLLGCGAPEGIVRCLDDTAQKLFILPVTPETYGPLHYDFEPDNVFWDGAHISVIDFDGAMQGWFALDVEQALDSLHSEFGLQNSELSEAFMRGYRSVRPLAQEAEAQRTLMRRFVNLRHYARLPHCLSEDISGPQRLEALKDRLSQAKERLEQRILHP